MDKEIQIRNSTADFLIFTRQNGELNEISVCRKFRHTADDGKNYQSDFDKLVESMNQK